MRINETPEVNIALTSGNRSFYLPGMPLNYKVTVSDKSDTAKFDPANLYVSVDYIEGFDKAASNMGHQQGEATVSGKNIMLSLDCKSCHKEAETSVETVIPCGSTEICKRPQCYELSHTENKEWRFWCMGRSHDYTQHWRRMTCSRW